MSNWFESNPTKSIITYTLVIVTFTWAASFFVLDENKVNLYKAQVENEKTVNRQLNVKISVLEEKLLSLSNENNRFEKWLFEDTSSYPFLIEKITELEKKIKTKDLKKHTTDKAKQLSNIVKKPYLYSEVFVMGQSFTDPLTNATLGVSQISIKYTADIYLYLPGKEVIEEVGIKPGTSWIYEYNKKQYKLTLNTVNWTGSTLKATVVEVL